MGTKTGEPLQPAGAVDPALQQAHSAVIYNEPITSWPISPGGQSAPSPPAPKPGEAAALPEQSSSAERPQPPSPATPGAKHRMQGQYCIHALPACMRCSCALQSFACTKRQPSRAIIHGVGHAAPGLPEQPRQAHESGQAAAHGSAAPSAIAAAETLRVGTKRERPEEPASSPPGCACSSYLRNHGAGGIEGRMNLR
jgi:hypothetical protein